MNPRNQLRSHVVRRRFVAAALLPNLVVAGTAWFLRDSGNSDVMTVVAIILNILLCAFGILVAVYRKEADKCGRFIKDMLFAVGVPLLACILVVIGISLMRPGSAALRHTGFRQTPDKFRAVAP